jgi:hypothetical protein
MLPLHTILHEADPGLVRRFAEYHQQNPQVFDEFRRRAIAMRTAGRRKYSQWTIIQSIRWDHDLRTTGDVFKINNDFIALYARLLIHELPEFKDFFELRTMKPHDRRSSDEERYRKEGVQ